MSFSVWTLFWQADLVVKMVILGLCAGSLWSWYIIFVKSLQLQSLENASQRFERLFWSQKFSLDEIYARFARHPADPMAMLFKECLKDLPLSSGIKKKNEDELQKVRHYLAQRMEIGQSEIAAKLEHGLNWLATLASTAPFVGLFGTVWGIMMSFQSIASAGDTSLVVVAPAISEALFATALGLFVAIPAQMAYNRLSHRINAYQDRVAIFGSKLSDFLLRHFEGSAS